MRSRDTIWVKSTTTLQNGQITGTNFLAVDIPCNATYITNGLPPPFPDLKGHIEHLTVTCSTKAVYKLDVLWLSNGAVTGYIDHESFASTDFWQVGGTTGPKRAAKSNLQVPYRDKKASKTFHLGLINRATTAIPTKTLTIEFSFRQDIGDRVV